jgi:hypothetical protein
VCDVCARHVQAGDRRGGVYQLLGQHVLGCDGRDVYRRVLELPGELAVGGVERGVCV